MVARRTDRGVCSAKNKLVSLFKACLLSRAIWSATTTAAPRSKHDGKTLGNLAEAVRILLKRHHIIRNSDDIYSFK